MNIIKLLIAKTVPVYYLVRLTQLFVLAVVITLIVGYFYFDVTGKFLPFS